MLDSLRDIPIVGDVRGTGYFRAIELVRDKATKETFTGDEEDWLLRGFLSPEMFRRGLICRADDRGDPVIQFSPPLIAGPEQFEEIALRPAAGARGGLRAAAPRRLNDADAPPPGPDPRSRRPPGGRARPGSRTPCGGSTSPSSTTRRRGCRAGSCCSRPGCGWRTPRRQRAFVERLAGHGLAGLGSAPASRMPRCPRPCATRPPSWASRCSRCPTTCRSSRSPRRRPRTSSTSTTPCSSGRCRRTSGWSGSCSPSAGSTASPRRSRR